MQALVKFASGPGNVELRIVPEPSPAPGQVMVEVEYAGICASDLHIRNWDIQLLLRTPVIMDHENVCVGKELIGYVHDGCFAQYVVVHAERHTLFEGIDLLSAYPKTPAARNVIQAQAK